MNGGRPFVVKYEKDTSTVTVMEKVWINPNEAVEGVGMIYTAPRGDKEYMRVDSPVVWSGIVPSPPTPATTEPKLNPGEISGWAPLNWEGYSVCCSLEALDGRNRMLVVSGQRTLIITLQEGEETNGIVYSEKCHNDVWYTLLETDSHVYLVDELMRISKNKLRNAGVEDVYNYYYEHMDQFVDIPECDKVHHAEV